MLHSIRKVKILISVLLLFILIVSVYMTDAHALTPIPEPIQIDLGDGLVFHLTPTEFLDQGYPESGLYRDEELVYTFDDNNDWRRWLLFDNLYFSDDAMTFLSVPLAVGSTNPDGKRIHFYSEGVLMHDIGIGQFIKHGTKAFDEPDQFTGLSSWLIFDETRHDRANNKLEVITIEGYKVLFDLSTGTVLSQEISPEHVPPKLQAARTRMVIALICGVSLIFGVVIFYLIKRHSMIKK